jgi:hypothetical protein
MALQLLAGVCFDDKADGGIEVSEAMAKGEVPTTPLLAASHREQDHREQNVQRFLQAQGFKSSYVYQSVFVIDDCAEKPERKIVEAYGHAFVVKPELLAKLVVASLGDMRNVVDKLAVAGKDFSIQDDRFIGLDRCPDRTAALFALTFRAAVENARKHANPIYVEGRLYRSLENEDLLRPCTDADLWKRRSRYVRRAERGASDPKS